MRPQNESLPSSAPLLPQPQPRASTVVTDPPPAAQRRAAPGWVENRPPSGWLEALNLRELWAFRELGFVLAVKRFKIRYKQSVLGVAWAIVQPVVGVVVFGLIFGHFAQLPSDGLPYPLFVLGGLVLWSYCSAAVTGASESLAEDRNLVTKIYFPRLLAPLAALLPGIVDLAVGLALVAVAMAFYGVAPPLALLLLPLWLGALILLALGVGACLAALNALYRDVRYALLFLTQMWFYASPVVFPSSLVVGPLRYVLALNPLVGILDGFRWSLLGAPPPPPADLCSLGTGVVLLVAGVAYFMHVEREVADHV
jgi:lipopolysaccharide transport system permease protein